MAHEFLGLALKTGLLICAAGIASLALAHRSAATRHLVWMSALALALLLPLASALVPSYAVMEDPWAVPVQAAVAAQPAAAGGGWSADLIWSAVLAVWGAGALLFLLRDTLGHAGLTRFGRRARPLRSPQWRAALRALEGPATMRVLESDRVAGPCTWGFLRPVLVLPQAAENWSEAERRYALTHELAHIRRRDYVSAQIARLACAVHWYNPLVWYAARQAHKLQEQACDDAVLRAGAVPSDYARLLVGVAASCSCSPRAAMGMAERSPLYHRVTAILDPRKTRSAQSRTGAVATVLPLACVMALIAGASLAEPELARAAEPVAAAAPTAEPVAAATVASDVTPAKVVHARRHRTPAGPPPPPSPSQAWPAHETSQAQAALPALPPVPALAALPATPPPPPPLKPVPPLPPVPPPSD